MCSANNLCAFATFVVSQSYKSELFCAAKAFILLLSGFTHRQVHLHVVVILEKKVRY